MTSARTVERLARILAMLPWVIANPGASTAEICSRFGYRGARDLVDDLNLIFVCGLPGYGPGDLIDASFDDDAVVIDMADYFARPMRLTATEALVMLAAGLAVLSIDGAPPALKSAVDKLSTALLPEEGLVGIDLGPEPELVALLRSAAAGHEAVAIRYTAISSGATTERTVEPWAVFATMGNWYLSGHCRRAGGERVFRIDRIQEATATGERFAPPTDVPAASVRYSPGADDPIVHLRLAPGAAWVADYYPVDDLGSDDGGRLVAFAASDLAVVARLVIRLGGSAEIVGGPQAAEARDAVRAMRERLLARYR